MFINTRTVLVQEKGDLMKDYKFHAKDSLKQEIDYFISTHKLNMNILSKAEKMRLLMPIIVEHKNKNAYLTYAIIDEVLNIFGIENEKNVLATRVYRERAFGGMNKNEGNT